MYNVRYATQADAVSLLELMESAKIKMGKKKIQQWTAQYPNIANIEEDIKNNTIYVIEKRTTILGCVTFDKNAPQGVAEYINGKKVRFLKRLIISPFASGRGLARMLVDYCERHFIDDGTIIYSLTNHTNTVMKNLFHQTGFKKITQVKLADRLEFGDFILYEKQLKEGGKQNMGKVIVLGSLNIDTVITAERMPKIGETIMGSTVHYMVGGKGANQAVASSRMGIETIMLGKVGDDTFGEKILKHLFKDGVNIDHIIAEENVFTGMAHIYKMPEDNSITVISGANELVEEQYVQDHQELITEQDVVLSQLEIPVLTVLAGMKKAKELGAITILNPAPYDAAMACLIPYVDIITPNETEFEAMVGKSELDRKQLETEMLAYGKEHDIKLIVTIGSQGVLYTNEQGTITHVPSPKVTVVDTTGAGDTFNGVLSAKLVAGVSFDDAILEAAMAASVSVTKLGAQTGIPTAAELKAFMNKTH